MQGKSTQETSVPSLQLCWERKIALKDNKNKIKSLKETWLESESIQEKMLKLQKLAAVRRGVWDVLRYVASIVVSGTRTRQWEPLNALG